MSELEWMDEARQIAAQCWCDPETEQKIMDPVLAESIAKRIALWMETGARHAKNEEYWRERATKAEEAIAAMRSEPVAWSAHGIKREDTCVWVQDSDGPWNTSCGKVFEFTNEGPAENEANFCYHCGGALLPEPYSDAAPSRETAKPEAEPALSADPIDIKKRIANGYADDITADEIIALCNMALSSLTARDEGIEAEVLREALVSLVAVARRYLPDYDEHPEIQKADAALSRRQG